MEGDFIVRSGRLLAGAISALAVIHCGGGGSSGHGSERAATTAAPGDDGIGGRSDGSGCAQLTDTSREVYVNGRGVEGTGAPGCPFHSIAKAVEIAAKRSDPVTIHVAEGEYQEPSALALRSGITVTGAGAGKVIVHSGGACAEGAMACGVFVGGGAKLEGVTVINAHGVAVVTAANGLAVLQDVRATGSSEAGILVRGEADMKDVVCDHNKGDGLRVESVSVSTVKVGTSNAGMSHFDDNERNGIQVLARGVLELTGASASSNEQHGVRIATDGEVTARPHVLVGMDANQNAGNGIESSGASLRVRASVALKNNGSGLVFLGRGLADAHLDLGTATDPGQNAFSTSRKDALNRKSGVCVDLGPSTQAVLAIGDRWGSCPARQMMIEGECDDARGQADVAFRARPSGVALLPLSAGACEVCR